MIEVKIKTKNGLIHSFNLKKGDDFLSTLDKFLKKNKIVISGFVSIEVDCGSFGDSVSCKIAKISIKTIKLAESID